MDVIGIELEQEAINDVTNVLKETTWETGKHFDGESKIKDNGRYLKKDSLLTYLKVFRQAPGAIRLENQWLKGTPKNNEKIHESLKEHTGHDFPILKKFNRVKLKRVMATALRENFTETNTNIGLRSKIICGVIFSVIIENTYLKDHLLILAENNKIKINPEFLKAIVESPVNDFDFDKQSLSKQETVAFAFTLQASNSPANIDESITKEVITHLTPASIVELTTWLSILQALHRLVKLPIS